MKIKQLADEGKWYFSQIAALSPDQIAGLNEEAHQISESFEVALKKNDVGDKVTISVDAYWSQRVDVLFWPHPPTVFYPTGILFSGYGEFLRWMNWRLLAMSCSRREADRVCNEMEGWREKVLCPWAAGKIRVPVPPLSSDIELR